MRTLLFLVGFLFYNSIRSAQKIKIIDQSSTTFTPCDAKKVFYYLDSNMDKSL
jgi:hypothetical protein